MQSSNEQAMVEMNLSDEFGRLLFQLDVLFVERDQFSVGVFLVQLEQPALLLYHCQL